MILGSQPHDDGTFDRTNTFTTLVSNGAWSVPSADAARRADQVAYIVPAAKGVPPPTAAAEPRESVCCHGYLHRAYSKGCAPAHTVAEPCESAQTSNKSAVLSRSFTICLQQGCGPTRSNHSELDLGTICLQQGCGPTRSNHSELDLGGGGGGGGKPISSEHGVPLLRQGVLCGGHAPRFCCMRFLL